MSTTMSLAKRYCRRQVEAAWVDVLGREIREVERAAAVLGLDIVETRETCDAEAVTLFWRFKTRT